MSLNPNINENLRAKNLFLNISINSIQLMNNKDKKIGEIPFEDDNLSEDDIKIKRVRYNYKLNNTTITLIELANGYIIQLGKVGISFYRNLIDFSRLTIRNSTIENHNFKFISFI